ncbi:hypothetical protein [Bradyrhizobium sp. LHD-71]|uniref:hypothetical protein n=1 Tax=Bradyrhizobium sp. LHD-71 TaxID=3072141 RepID=UPI00280ED388|nr:hypothetical protein [Bradyrhizobium sp. LHD-71]MDQ8729600.1 hypothetical protein [Bradyrhizobium sp. LHD-71]
MAKAKAKAAVKRKPATTQARAAATRAAKAPKKAAAKPVKSGVAKPVKSAAKTPAAKSSVVKAAAAKTSAAKSPAATAAKPGKVTPVVAAERKAEQLTLPMAKPVEAPTKPAAVPTKQAQTQPVVATKPLSIVRKPHAASPRADLPPDAGFTLLVDGHFKNQFDDLKDAKAAASDLKGRFPMLKIEIYDAATKTRLPA